MRGLALRRAWPQHQEGWATALLVKTMDITKAMATPIAIPPRKAPSRSEKRPPMDSVFWRK